MDVQDIFIMEAILTYAIDNGGVVRPIDIERIANERHTGHTSYKIRKVFGAMRDAGILCFNHTYYAVTAENQLNFLTTDAGHVANGEAV